MKPPFLSFHAFPATKPVNDGQSMEHRHIYLLPHLILRTTAYSYWQYREKTIINLLQDKYFIEAISYASDSILQELQKAQFDIRKLSEKVKMSPVKYFNRFACACGQHRFPRWQDYLHLVSVMKKRRWFYQAYTGPTPC